MHTVKFSVTNSVSMNNFICSRKFAQILYYNVIFWKIWPPVFMWQNKLSYVKGCSGHHSSQTISRGSGQPRSQGLSPSRRDSAWERGLALVSKPLYSRPIKLKASTHAEPDDMHHACLSCLMLQKPELTAAMRHL